VRQNGPMKRIRRCSGTHSTCRDDSAVRDHHHRLSVVIREGVIETGIEDETDTLPPVRISRREAFSFALARKLLAHYEDTPLHLDMRSVLDKIAESLAGDVIIAE